jgi:hypothetical protein
MRSLSPALLLLAASLPQAQGAARDPGQAGVLRGAALPAQRELAGKRIAGFPHFQTTRSFNAGQPVHVAFDPLTDAGLAKRAFDVYVIEHEALPQHLAGKKLSSATGAPLRVKLTAGSIKENAFLLDAGTLSGAGVPDANGTVLLGKGYDVVADVDGDGGLGAADVLDGSLEQAGFYVVEDFVTLKRAPLKETGPYSVREVLFNGGSTFTREDVYFPEKVAELGQLPLIVVSHGNGHQYTWYDHIGYHMASWGYVVMSHANNTGPGIETASTSTLRNTDLFLGSLETIAGGALAGHVDGHRIVWIGHSRGGEGVARAYRRVSNIPSIVANYGPSDIKLVSSIAPTDFLGVGVSDMGAAPYHLWTGGADSDVNGCADCDICQTFHLLERADGTRLSTSLHGAGHGDFHDGDGGAFAAGPCRIGKLRTHQIMRAYLLPLVQFTLDQNPACLDYLTRQWEEFRASGAPDPGLAVHGCVVVDLMYLPGPERGRLMIDDFQSEPATTRSSSGAEVRSSPGLVASLREGRLDDPNGSFTTIATQAMNGMTLAGPGDTSAGSVLEWDGTDEWLMFEVPAGLRDLGALRTLSFRAAQSTRHALTTAEAGDLHFSVQLVDSARRASTIRIGAYGGGIEEPYQRGGCGQGNGWANEFETIRIPLADFRRDGNALDLTDVVAITFLFGPSHGSRSGRIGLDEVAFTGD